MQGNEKLLVARAEIEAILKKHDIGAHVVLHMIGGGDDQMTQSYTENFGHYNPSYSRIRPMYDEHGTMTALHISSKLDEHYNGNRAAQKRDLEATAAMLQGMAILLAQDAMSLLEVSKQLDAFVGIEHGKWEDLNPKRGKGQ